MGSRLERKLDMSYENAINILNYCHNLGSENLTIIGGEPTLHKDLTKIVDSAIQIGYNNIYIDTNGLAINNLKTIDPQKLTYIRFSLDGATAETHEKVRGSGTYEKTIKSIKKLIKENYQVGITCTIFKFNINDSLKLLDLAEKLGIKLINYHVFSEEGRGKRNSDWGLSPKEWINFYEHIETLKHKYQISIWYPPTWTTHKNLYRYVDEGYRGCPGCTLDRLSIFPDGKSYICSVLFDESLYFGTITDKGFILNREHNEFEIFTKAAFSVSKPWLSGCPAESILEKNGKKETPSEYISICRCWKSQI
ncbi:MAG: Radical SAM domain-containing protein [Candidatus Magnetoglobus multicellularis str. Araruama]|uniref:Radical SAM domain-containing protein n=1 Tax=Candidatus Magnetoglobus multicellularis str. Araruama TaxID=890399 RepID=A0A1V1PBA3_9BACT|nr:MAG: Radical SAM domain-containing protein [Candidatus Magnetoglobus multicellularis str. Araruama]